MNDLERAWYNSVGGNDPPDVEDLQAELRRTKADLSAAQTRIAELEAGQGWEPDWSKAPAWAQWYAMDSTGWCYWYQVEPEPKSAMGDWSARGRRHEPAKQIAHPGWLDTKRCRPQEGSCAIST